MSHEHRRLITVYNTMMTRVIQGEASENHTHRHIKVYHTSNLFIRG